MQVSNKFHTVLLSRVYCYTYIWLLYSSISDKMYGL